MTHHGLYAVQKRRQQFSIENKHLWYPEMQDNAVFQYLAEPGRTIFPKWNQMFAIWEWDNESREEYLSGVDTANMVVNTVIALSVLLYSFIMTPLLWGLTFPHGLMPHLEGLQRNKVL